ncbi:MAG: CDGSH iron-sulfur domain-containing protein [Geminicoccaceae bacterium]
MAVTTSQAIVAQKGPFAVELQVGRTYAWCACGRSGNQPFWDGSHKSTSLTPVVFRAERAGTAYLCGGKTSKGRPYCDGSHDRL